MFTLVRFETAFVLECALTRLSRQGYVGFEAEGALLAFLISVFGLRVLALAGFCLGLATVVFSVKLLI